MPRVTRSGLVTVTTIGLAGTAVGVGIIVGWLASGRFVAIGSVAALMAAGIGYSKAYSP